MANIFETIREIKEITGFNRAEALEALREAETSDDFTLGNFRFIESSSIDDIMAEEMESCEYTLGCYAAGAIADATGWPTVLIEAAQSGDEFQKIGQAISEQEYTSELQDVVRRYDGYGAHFALYDRHEHDIVIGRATWYVFKVQ